MSRRLKLFSGLSTVALTSALTLGACGGEGEGGEGVSAEGVKSFVSGQAEGAEGEGADMPGEGKTIYMAQLFMIEGHLQAGVWLYEAGEAQMALSHMKHPQSELYADMVPVFDTFSTKGFAGELTALANAVKAGDPKDSVVAKLGKVDAEVTRAMGAAAPAVKDVLLAVVLVLRIAGEEFDAGIASDGAVENLHEYQDAYGFINASLKRLADLDGKTADENAAIAKAREQTAIALTAAPTPLPGETVKTKSATIYGAASRIEISALGL